MVTGLALALLAVSPAVTRGPLESYVWVGRQLTEGRFGPHVYDDVTVADATADMTGGRIRDFLSPSPPSIAPVMVPFAVMPDGLRPLAWAVANGVALIGTVWLLTSTLRLRSRAQLVGAVLFLSLPASAPFQENLERGQVYLLMMLAAAAIVAGGARGRPRLGGAGLTALLLMKCAGWPIALVMAAAGGRRWLLWALAPAAQIAIALTPWIGLETWRLYVVEVVPAWVGAAKASVTAYQTVPGFFAHLFRYDATWNLQPVADVPSLALMGTAAVAVAAVGVLLHAARRDGLPCALPGALVLTVLLSPVAEQYHYLLGVPAAVAVLDRVSDSWLRLACWTLAMALLLVPLPFKSPALAGGWLALLAYPRLYGGALLWILAVTMRARTEGHAPS